MLRFQKKVGLDFINFRRNHWPTRGWPCRSGRSAVCFFVLILNNAPALRAGKHKSKQSGGRGGRGFWESAQHRDRGFWRYDANRCQAPWHACHLTGTQRFYQKLRIFHVFSTFSFRCVSRDAANFADAPPAARLQDSEFDLIEDSVVSESIDTIVSANAVVYICSRKVSSFPVEFPILSWPSISCV